MARAVLIGNVQPLDPSDLEEAGHDLVHLNSLEEVWDYIGRGLGAELVVVGSGFSQDSLDQIMEWLEEETDSLPVWVLSDPNVPYRAGYGHFTVTDSSTTAFGVLVPLLSRLDKGRGRPTVDEKLSDAGLLEQFDVAFRSGNRDRMIALLTDADLADQADWIADRMLKNPWQFGR